MKIFNPSIKLQLTAAYLVLIIPGFMLGALILSTYSIFTKTTQATIGQEKILNLTSSLQREVIDLQRNVLIYKSTVSKSSEKNINNLYKNLKATLVDLKTNELNQENIKKIEQIEKHIKDYKDNFDIVINNREYQKNLIKIFIDDDLSNTSDHIKNENIPENEKKRIINHIHIAQRHSLSYLVTTDQEHIKAFKDNIMIAQEIASENFDINTKLKIYKNKFQKIVSLQRNYIYLINVVMAGSAKEILYHANELSFFTREQTAAINYQATAKLENQKNIIYIALLISLVMAFTAPLYFFRLITQPIQRITNVFTKLSADQSVDYIPGQERTDEIGMLAQAANVFRSKNKQTQELLTQAQESIKVQKLLNDDLKDAKAHAEKSLSVKSDFLANMSHELRTPLNSVIGYTVRMLKNHEGLTLRQEKSLHAIERNGKHLLSMINDILDLSKIEANKLEVRLTSVNIHNLCYEAISQIKLVSDNKGLTIKLESKISPKLEVKTDSVRLLQILINILSNAVKYTEKGSVNVAINKDSKLRAVVIDIEDTGIGIKPENIGRLFNRFEQFDSETRFDVGHGTGLGLSIVDSLSKLLSIHIKVTSEFGKGSKFSIILPFDPEVSHKTWDKSLGLTPNI